jgi:hypothetical protein
VTIEFENAVCGIDVSPPERIPDAIRIVLDTDTFDTGGTWEHVADLDLPKAWCSSGAGKVSRSKVPERCTRAGTPSTGGKARAKATRIRRLEG